jgi:hypothetical protein
MYEYGNWEQGRAVWFLGIHNSNLLCSVDIDVISHAVYGMFLMTKNKQLTLLSQRKLALTAENKLFAL